MEFLDAVGETRYRTLIEEKNNLEPLSEPFHNDLIHLLKTYYFTGGMPEVIASYAETGEYETVRSIQNNIIKTYELDFAKHAPAADIPKLSTVWNSIPIHLSRENKKFIFSALSKSARGVYYEFALRWLNDAGLIHMVYSIEKPKLPLRGQANPNCFKVYSLDIGLLGALAGIEADILVNKNDLFTTYHGAFVENYTAQQLAAYGKSLYYWRSESHKAEIDFLYEYSNKIYPLEVKAGINPKSKSLRSYNNKYNPQYLLRTTLLNMRKDGKILNIPLYMINQLEKILNN